jgi:imidazolonepropionase-like amidohydrolase
MKSSRLSLLLGIVIFSVLGLLTTNAQSPPATQKSYKFINGQWFDGKGFKRQTFYSVNGTLTQRKPKQVDETVDLDNKFVIPPFADAHTHNLDGMFNFERVVQAYLAEGTFYLQVLANHGTGATQARPLLNNPSTLDVVYANGMLTCTYGHPFMIYEPLAMGIYNPAEAYRRIPEVKKSRLAENNAYWFLDSRTDVDAKWERILAAKPDLIKIGLLDAENQEKYVLTGDTLTKGLSPEVAEYVVQKAHQAGLRVYAHIETANDFRLGLRIGVDGFAHAPNYGWKGNTEDPIKDELTIEDVKLAAKKKTIVIPTARLGRSSATDYAADGKQTLVEERFRRIIERQKRLFNLMRQSGVTLALGSDNYGRTLGDELWYLHDNQIFDNLTLLRIATEITPQTIFPDRKIGRLREGYEASFLVVNGNPLEDFSRIKKIERRFKQGEWIKLAR